MAYLVRIGSIWGDILKQIHLSAFQEKTGLPTNEFSQFVKRLEKWRIELPPGLEYSNENLAGQIEVGTTGAFVVMHVMWHTAMAYVYRYVRTVGGAKEYIEKNIPRKEVVESIRKAFVHADAVLQIMCHVRIRRDLARESNGKPVTVNAPFLGQAIYDACSIAAIRAQEVKDTESAAQQKARIKVGVSWLRELKRWWKPIQGLHKKLNAIYNNLDRGTSRQAQIAVPTPESVTDTALQPGSQFNPVDPENYTDPSSYPGAGVDASRTSFHVYHDYMAVNFSDPSYFNEALGGPGSMNAISDYAVLEGGFAELYLPFETDTGISAPFDNQIQAPTAFAMGQGIADLMQIDLPTNPEELGYVMEEPDLSRVYEESEDEDGSGSPSADETAEDPNINTVYFDTNAVREGNLQETSSETSSRSRRSSDAAAPTKHEGNPMDVLNLINNDQEMQDEVKTSLQKGMGQDKFTGPDGEAAPGNTEMGGKPSMENMDNDQWGATKQRCM